MKQIAEHWLNAAQDDLRVVARIASDEHLTHMVAFHSQQCIEKSLYEQVIRKLSGLDNKKKRR
jgi:HEPN domain-containing protein